MSNTNKSGGGSTYMLDFGSGQDPFSAVTVEKEETRNPEEDIVEEIEEEEEPTLSENQPPEVENTIEEEEGVDQDEDLESSEEDDDLVDEDGDGEGENEPSLYYHIAKDLQQDSFLPDTAEFDEAMSGSDLKSVIKDSLKASMEEQIRSEVYETLVNSGYDEKDLLIARAIRQGVDYRLLSTSSMYETYANMADDADDLWKESAITQMYKNRGFKDDEINDLLTIAKSSDEKLKEIYDQSRDYFSAKYQEFVKEEQVRADRLEKEGKDKVREANALIDKVIKTGKIDDGLSIAKEKIGDFEKAIRVQDQTIDVGGQKFRASEIQKFLYEFQTNDAIKLAAFYLYKFRDSQLETLKSKVKKEVEADFLSAYNSKTIKKKRRTSNRKKQPARRPEVNKTYIVDYGSKR